MVPGKVVVQGTEDRSEDARIQDEAPRAIHFDVFTLFPQIFVGALSESILARAQKNGILQVALHNIREFTTDRHHVCDGYAYGGGGGMVMRPEPVVRAVETVLGRPPGWRLPRESANCDLPGWDAAAAPILEKDTPVILLTPQGRPFDQAVAEELSQHKRLALICGRYEGVDERIRTQLATDEISIGDYVLSGGEFAALAVIDAVTRLLPAVLGREQAAERDSFSAGTTRLLEGPQFTRPARFRGEAVPDVLISGHHANVARWRREQSLLRTLRRRPDLLTRAAAAGHLASDDLRYLSDLGWRPREGSS